jgi:hypothetical protein
VGGWLLYRQACCWEVGSSEAKSSKDRERERAMEEVEKEEERKRWYGCKA